LEQLLSQVPKRDDWTTWYWPGGILIDRGIGMCNWHTNDVLEIRRHSGEEFSLHIKFRHGTYIISEAREKRLEYEARKSVEIPHNLIPQTLKTFVYEERPLRPFVMVYEKFYSKEAVDNVPKVYVLVKIDENRHRQYKGQRVVDVIHQYACRESREQSGPSVGELIF
jgi:hypothetical protein